MLVLISQMCGSQASLRIAMPYMIRDLVLICEDQVILHHVIDLRMYLRLD